MEDTQYLDFKLNELEYDVIVVGSGAAGFNAANRSYEKGFNVCLVTEEKNISTSRNAGSDKQTYYKLSLCNEDLDSVDKMAKVYCDGYHMDSDIAKVEAAGSVRAFMNLVELAVAFPTNEYGEFIGYKTDHDPNKRATSAGPYTSKMMVEKLEQRFFKYGIELLNHHKVVKIFNSYKFNSILTFHKNQFYLIYAKALIYATGGPASIYKNTVYPYGQKGSTGIALESGVKGRNLTHFQYGLASKKPKWNVSGTYMQCLPWIYSEDENRRYDFLLDYYKDRYSMLNNVFLKGYQWPFDLKKIKGSSYIDYLVYIQEIKFKRKIYMDFRANPQNAEIQFQNLNSEALEYLESNDAFLDTPIDRLIHMNKKAYKFYLDKGIDLKKDRLEISLCAQHNNGGLMVDKNYQTNIKNFFAVGEVAATHGIYRPGGSALNAGQVGAFRAANSIDSKLEITKNQKSKANEFIFSISKNIGKNSNVIELINNLQEEMSKFAAAFRRIGSIKKMLEYRIELYQNFETKVKANKGQIIKLFELRDILISQIAYLYSMLDYNEYIKSDIGGCLYYDDKIEFDIKMDDFKNEIQEIEFNELKPIIRWIKTKKLEDTSEAFEVVWKRYLNKRC
ncbi:MAG: FAD-binding protein [Helcococcus sp.]|nr:FAD-binding protein [Helcococcus sp.]